MVADAFEEEVGGVVAQLIEAFGDGDEGGAAFVGGGVIEEAIERCDQQGGEVGELKVADNIGGAGDDQVGFAREGFDQAGTRVGGGGVAANGVEVGEDLFNGLSGHVLEYAEAILHGQVARVTSVRTQG